MKKIILFIFISSFYIGFSQGSIYYKGGFKITFDEEELKYLRILSWVQAQANFQENVPKKNAHTNFQLRRGRILLYGQITPKFLVLTHIGVNSLNADKMSPTGTGNGSQIFMHDAWVQYNLNENHSVGAGLHYFNGVSRLNSQGTLNLMTLDNNRSSWSTLGLSDQFARHVGVFAKGNFGKLQYQLAVNDAVTNSLDERNEISNTAVYRGKEILGSKSAGKTYAGYFSYNLLEMESNFLPYKVGSYLGTKDILNIGGGFFHHPNGSVIEKDSELLGEDINLFAVDVFLDKALNSKGSAVTFYGVYQHNNYGSNYVFGPYGTGSMIYSHLGYLLPYSNESLKWQPYVSFSNNDYDAFQQANNIRNWSKCLFQWT